MSACPFERAKLTAAGIAYDPAAEAKHKAAMKARKARSERDKARYAEWEAGGKKPSPKITPKAKPQYHQKAPHHVGFKQRLINAQGGVCFLCGLSLTVDESLSPSDPNRSSFDHVLPKALGGNDRKNRLAAHRSCNTLKSDRAPFACELLFLRVVNIYVDTNRANGKMGQQKRRQP